VLQGLGPVLLVPGSLTLIRSVCDDDRQQAQAIGLWSTGSGLGMAAGPVVGGLITAHLGWRWVFGVNVPLGWTSPPVLAGFALSAGSLAGFVAREQRAVTPLVDISLFRRPAFAAANIAALVVFFAFIGAYFQQVQRDSPVRAGFEVAITGMAFAVAAPLSGRLTGRAGPCWPMLGGLVVAGAAMLGLLRLQTSTGAGAIWWDFALAGAGVGMCLTPMTQVAVSAVGTARAGIASAVHNALRQAGQVLGVAVLGALVYARVPAAIRLHGAQAVAFTSGLRGGPLTVATVRSVRSGQ
jgi:MFS transporter, DHA2 family, methylenomycin A resistance protein